MVNVNVWLIFVAHAQFLLSGVDRSTVDPVITFLVALLRGANYEGVALKKWWNKYKNHFMK